MINLKHATTRAELLRQSRSFFDARGFLEVQPPCLARDCVVDAYLDPIAIETKWLGVNDERLGDRYFLQTSPESAMKRMLAAGAPSIYSLGPVFRSGELGKQHNLEFTMLEWYEVEGDYESAISITADYIRQVLSIDQVDRVRYQDAFWDAVSLDPFEASDEKIAELARQLAEDLIPPNQHPEPAPITRDDLLDIILSYGVAPTLGIDRPTLMMDYPISQAALAKTSPTDPRCAARFELFIDGVEIANGYDELLDADELATRFHFNNQRRAESGRSALSTETTLIDAMRKGLPPCSGVALGLDRLLMVMVGANDLAEVIPLTFWHA